MATELNEVKTITKANIVQRVHEELEREKHSGEKGISKKESAKLVDMVFQTIKDQIQHLRHELNTEIDSGLIDEAKRERRLKISGFGNFIVRHKGERVGRNPKNGKRIKISSRYVLTFKPSQVLKKAINEN